MQNLRWTSVSSVALLILASGCTGRIISEARGAAQGASGKPLELQSPGDLAHYRGIRAEEFKIAPGVNAPSKVPSLLSKALIEKAADLQLTPDGNPALVVTGEVIHFEKDDIVDKAIGPLQEIILRAQLRDAETQQLLGEANLVGRAKALSASGTEQLCEGVGRALRKWLKEHGLKEPDDEKK